MDTSHLQVPTYQLFCSKRDVLLPPLAPPSANEYGLFRPDEDPTKGRWLEQGRTLEYYHLKDGVSVATIEGNVGATIHLFWSKIIDK